MNRLKNECLYCELPVYAKHLCRRHYKKMNAIKNGTYKKLYEKRKKDAKFMEKKKMLDKIYREKKALGLPVNNKKNDMADVNFDWSKYYKEWKNRPENRTYISLRKNKAFFSKRLEIIKHYSNGRMSCCRCGANDPRVLDIDHVNDDGATHRKSMKTNSPVYWIVKNNFPEGFQILCKNCNWIKEVERKERDFLKRNEINIEVTYKL